MTFEQIQQAIQHASASVSEMHQNLKAFFSALPDPFFIIDIDGNYVEVLGGNDESLYADGSELKGKHLADVFSEEICQLFMHTLQQAIKSQSLQVIEYQLRPEQLLQDCGVRADWYQGRVAPIVDPKGNTGHVVWLAINISEKKQMEEELRFLAERDPLTACYNRRYFQETLQFQFKIFKRYKVGYSVLYLDIDHFKAVNDTFGHDIGDAAIKHLVSCVSDCLRQTDLMARFGGEEFILMLPETSAKQAVILADRIREQVQSRVLEVGSQKVPFTVSIGLSEAKEKDVQAMAVVKRADEALYQSKHTGRNRVSIC